MDVAKSSIDVDTHASIIETLERQLAEIDDALKRVDQSQYGVCLNCGEKIPAERLQAVPSAIYCVDCQARIGAGGGAARAVHPEVYARWTPPPEADESEALSDKGVNSLDELSLRRERAENTDIEPEQPAPKRGPVRGRSRGARSRQQ